MPKNEIEKVTAEDVSAAERALAEGRERLERLHDAFVDGRGEWQDYLDQKAVIEFAEAQVLRVAADKMKYDRQVRDAALADLRKEIDSYNLASGDEFTKLLEGFEDAARSFAAAFKDRNDKIAKWSAAASDLGVQSMSGRAFPSADDAGIAVMAGPDSDLRVGDRVLSQRWSGRILTSVLHGLATTGDLLPYFRDHDGVAPMTLDDAHHAVSNLDHEATAVPDDALFFRKSDGALFITGPDNGYSDEVMKRDGLVQITREEAENA